ncbi:MAG TPA: aromatic ring-opening dioxygenase LigA [Acidimicrobiia bacterium]|nr:aromatic ring-opening dioxygenase LigA [Acidimicrobiia bacterium]
MASVILGLLLLVGGAATWVVVSRTLADQQIVTSDDACLPGRQVADPFTAYCQAKVIEKHTLEATDGFYYAELDREDPRREVALTSSFLQASLFTSILAFGVAAMAMGMGVLFILIGLGIRDVARRTVVT